MQFFESTLLTCLVFFEAITDLIQKCIVFVKNIYFIQILHEKQSNFQSFSMHKIIQNVHQTASIHHPHTSVSLIQLQHPRLPFTTPAPRPPPTQSPHTPNIPLSLPHRPTQDWLRL